MTTQLWDDGRITHEMYPLLSEVNDPRISEHGAYMLHPTLALKLVNRIRDDYEQRIADLEAEVARLRQEQWVPVTDGEYACPCADCQDPTSSGWLLYATTEQIGIVCADDEDNDRYVDLPLNLRLCRRPPQP